jgi:transposase
VIVVDNTPSHSKQEDKPPSKYQVSREIIAWPQRIGVACDIKMRKIVLMELVEAHRPKGKVFRVDQLLKHNGHEFPRLPPYMCELNAIELAWAKDKTHCT